MLILTMFSAVYAGQQYIGTVDDYSDPGNRTVDSDTSGDTEIPGAEEQDFNIWAAGGALVILVAAMAVGIVSGITIIGTGLSDPSQKILFNAIMFLGLWACLTVIAYQYMFATLVVTFLWLTLTTIYAIGVGIHVTDAGSS